MSTSLAEKPKRATQTAVETLESKSRQSVIYVTIKGVETSKVDAFLVKAAELANAPVPRYNAQSGSCFMGYDGTKEQLLALIGKMQQLESKWLSKATQRVPAGEPIPVGAGVFIRYNQVF